MSSFYNNTSKKGDVVIKHSKIKKMLHSKKIIIGIVLVAFIINLGLLFFIYGPKFKDVTIELGTNEVSLDDFLVFSIYKNRSQFVTKSEDIDFSKVSDIDIILSYGGKEENVTLHIVDTTPPEVEFQDIIKYTDYVVNADDFIVKKEDLSEMTTSAVLLDETDEYKDYTVTVKVTDAYGNVTSKDCVLTIAWLIDEVYWELGDKFSKSDVIVNMEKDADKLPDSEIDKVDVNTIGEYILTAIVDGVEYTSKVIVQDTTSPELILKNVSIYDDEKVSGKNAFIKLVSDASGEVTTTMKTDIDYSILGKQEIVIEAVDKYGNSVEKVCTLTRRKDTDGPVFSGLSDLTVAKNATINYRKGVKAVDAKDGEREFYVDSSDVDVSKAGTYYATYTSEDTKGNKTTKKRKITVDHDQEDAEEKFNEFYEKYLKGKSIYGMTNTLRSTLGYNHNWGGDDPLWYGVTKKTGNCYVHAVLLQKALTKAGYKNMIIHTIDKTHYWNLVYNDGVWRHYDSTPGWHEIGPLTDDEKYNSKGLYRRNWDRDAYPKAE